MHLHSFHSTLLNTFFVCLMFGTALPILYPIGLLTFVILYVLHRLQVFYFFKQPPMYDKELTSNTLKLIPFACIIHMFFTYWFLDNKQLFQNTVFPIETMNDVRLSGHHLS